MIDKINNNSISDVLNEVSRHRSGSSKNTAVPQADASLQLTHNALIEEAKQTQIQDQTAVERARQLINSGQLDTVENIRAAAEAIAQFDI
jgi:hypothetical protein